MDARGVVLFPRPDIFSAKFFCGIFFPAGGNIWPRHASTAKQTEDQSMTSPPGIPDARPGSGLYYGLIGAVVLVLAAAFAWAAGFVAPGRLTQSMFIARFQSIDGVHPGFRRNHAKGVCVTGWFDGNGAGSALSDAAVFRPGRSHVIGRFALAGGMPFQSDAPATVRSMALSLTAPDHSIWRMGINNIPVFPVRTPQEFYDFLAATRPDPATHAPDPARVGPFLKAHPATAAALGLLKARTITPGFADDTFNSLDAFLFTNAQGTTVPVRWAMVPETPPPADPAATGPDHLFDALLGDLSHGPLHWHLMLTVGQPGDPTADPTKPWPADRTTIDAGLLTLQTAEAEDGGPCTNITFDPLILPHGIAASDDPILPARSAVYARSFSGRAGETKPPSAITPRQIAGDHNG